MKKDSNTNTSMAPIVWMSKPPLIWILWTLIQGLRITGAFYHLTSPTHPCRVTSAENDTVDLLCQYKEGFITLNPHGASYPCASQKVVWQRAGYHLPTNITDTTKYGVWDAVPGWKMAAGHRISLLRIRDTQPEDIGMYQCRIQCRGTDGRIHTDHHMADLCMDNKSPGYSICGTRGLDNKCSWSFGNDLCDPECDKEEYLYDGFDCIPKVSECSPVDEESCRYKFANGVCDYKCESAACSWDGGDCIDKPLDFAEDIVVITLAKWYQLSEKVVDVKALGRSLSKLLRTIVRVMPDDSQGLYNRQGSSRGQDARWHLPDRRGYNSVRRFYLKIDNTMCTQRCFRSAELAARFIDQALKSKWDPGIPISSIGVLQRTVNRCTLENNTLLHIDLPVSSQKEGNPNIYSYTYNKTESGLPPLWLLVTAIIGGLVILVLILVIIIIIVRIRKLSREERQRSSTVEHDLDRIHHKSTPQGTDV